MVSRDAHASPHPGSGLPPRKIGLPVPGFPEFIGYDEQQTFGDLWQRYRQLVELKHLWRFRVDPDNVGDDSSRWHQYKTPHALAQECDGEPRDPDG